MTAEVIVEHYYQFATTGSEGGNTGSDDTLYATWDGNTLTLYNVQTPVYDANGDLAGYEYIDYVLELGNPLGSVAFVPSVIKAEVGYPTTDTPFGRITKHLSETAVADGSTDTDDEGNTLDEGTFMPVSDDSLSVSTTADLVYRLNPSNAYVEGATYSFITRNVTTRADGGDADDDDADGDAAANDHGDAEGLLTVVETARDGEFLTVTASLNAAYLSTTGYDLAALRTWIGTSQVVTSDYVVVEDTGELTPYIVDATKTSKGMDEESATEFYRRTKGFGTDGESVTEDSDFVHEFVTDGSDTEPTLDEDTGLFSLVNVTLNWDKTLDLNDIVGLYSYEALDYLAAMGIEPTYKFSLPEDYTLADGVNQQVYVTLKDGVVEAIGSTAVDKCPVVRCDAFIDGCMVATSYILIQILGSAMDDVYIPIALDATTTEHYLHYRKIEGTQGTPELLATWTYDEFAQAVGDATGIKVFDGETYDLTAFWTYYNSSDGLDADIYAYYEDENEVNPQGDHWSLRLTYSGEHATTGYWYAGGFDWHLDTTVSEENPEGVYVGVGVDNTIYTQHTYDDIDGDGAYYCLVMTIESVNTSVYPNICIYCLVHVIDDCESFALNELYQIKDPAEYGLDPDALAIYCKGQLGDGGWEMTTSVDEHFDGGSLFSQITAGENNVTGVSFDWAESYMDYEYEYDGDGNATPTDSTSIVTPAYNGGEGGTIVEGSSDVGLNPDWTFSEDCFTANMVYSQVLANGEYCPHDYWIVFVNPFLDGVGAASVDLLDGVGENTAETAEQVVIYDINGKAVLEWVETTYDSDGNVETEGHLALTDYAMSEYGFTSEDSFDVTYAFDEENGDYTYVAERMGADSTLEVDETTGEVTWENAGSGLQGQYTLYVIATVDFGVASADCTITVTLNPAGVSPTSLSPNVL